MGISITDLPNLTGTRDSRMKQYRSQYCFNSNATHMWAACDINVVPSCELLRRWRLLTTTAHHWGGLTPSSVRSSLPHWWGFWFALRNGWSLVSSTFSRSKLGWPLGHGVVTGPTADWGNSHNSGWKLSPSLCSQGILVRMAAQGAWTLPGHKGPISR